MPNTAPDTASPQEREGIFIIDSCHLGFKGTIAAFLIPCDDGFMLIETGPGATLAAVKAGIRACGFELEQLKHILLTHIHLDHAGAAGQLAADTGATVYVHTRGYPHLHNPERLMASAKRIYTDQMDRLWGDMKAIPEVQLEAVTGDETLELGGRGIKPLYTPGHASHHLAFLLDDGTLFTGDAAAIHFEGSSVIRPALPPPDINLELLQNSIDTMLAANPKRLMLTHYGEIQDAETHLRQVLPRSRAWANEILQGMRENEANDELVKRIASLGNAELVADNVPADVMKRHQMSSNYEMTVQGVTRYWQKHHPELVG